MCITNTFFRTSLLMLLVFFFANLITKAQEHYKGIEFHISELHKLLPLGKNGIDETSIQIMGDKVFIIADDSLSSMLQRLQIDYHIAISDMSKYFEERAAHSFKHNKHLLLSQNFKFGSMGGFFNLEELYSEFETLLELYPNLITKEIIGKSYENRDIYLYKIGVNKDDEHIPQILLTALHHAREPASASVLLYFLQDLLNKYIALDKEALFLLNNRNIFAIPVVNPDGYYYNQITRPNGGGLWRKNRRKNYDDSFGVDLNRNYGPMEFWDADIGGSSKNPSDITYRGTAPFSEYETIAIKNLCENNNFSIALNYHSYGNLLIYPWGVLAKDTKDSILYRKIGFFINSLNKYTYGLDNQTLNYSTQGNSDDWMYLMNDEKNTIYAFTPEIGNNNDYFWPIPERIKELCHENLRPNYEFLWSADANIKIINLNDCFEDEKSFLKVEIANIGTNKSQFSNTFSIHSLNQYIILPEFEFQLPALNPGESTFINVPIDFKYEFTNGDFVAFKTVVLQDGIDRIDTFYVRLAVPSIEVLFDNDASNWTLNDWKLVFDSSISKFVLADSPIEEPSSDNLDNYLTYDKLIRLNEGEKADIEFTSKWKIEKEWDGGVIEISIDNGLNWQNIATSRSVKGIGIKNSKQELGKYYFEGNFFDYFTQNISLDTFAGNNILLRFGVLTDGAVTYNGWMISDIKMKRYYPYSNIQSIHQNNIHSLIIKRGEHINVKLPSNDLNYSLIDMIGKHLINGHTYSNILYLNTIEMPIGNYLLQLSNDKYDILYRIIIIE